jgi:hypothetical protein
LQLGIVAKVVPLQDLLAGAKALALAMASAGQHTKSWRPVAGAGPTPVNVSDDLRGLAWSKAARAVTEGAAMTFADGLRRERELFADLATSEAAKELIRRFLNKA